MGKRKQIMTGNHSVDAFTKDGEYRLTKDVSRVLFLPDIHVPVHCKQSLSAVLKYAETVEWDLVVQLGDFYDFDLLSKWSKENLMKLEGGRVLNEYVEARKVLDDIQAAVRAKNPTADIVMLEGNHCWRARNAANRQPAFSGLIEVENNMQFDERNVLYWQYWTHKKPIKIGKLHAIHGMYIGPNHAKKTADSFGRSVVYGHTHDSSLCTKVAYGSEPIQCFSIGTLSQLELDYMGSSPSNWINAFGQAFVEKNGNFNFYTTNIIDGKFIGIDGQVYSG